MRTPKSMLVALFAVLSLFAVACGGDDEKTATPAPTGTASPTATSEPSETATSSATATASETATATGTAVTGPVELDLGDGTATSDGSHVHIPSVTMPFDGFVAIHGDEAGAPGAVIGVSDLLSAGTATEVEVELDQPLTASGTVYPMVHVDANGNGVYEFPGPDGPATLADGGVAVAALAVTVEAEEPTETATEEPTETATEEPTEEPTGEPTTVETREPDPEADAFAHAALLTAEEVGEGWTVTSDDEFSDSLGEGIDSDVESCQELNDRLEEANALTIPARIGRASRGFEGPSDDPNSILGAPQVDIEINVFDDESVPAEVQSLYAESLEGDLFQNCFQESILEGAPEGTDASIEVLEPSTEPPHDGSAIAFKLSIGAAPFAFTFVVEAYIWAQDDLGITVSFTGTEQNPELVATLVEQVHEKIDDTPR